MMHVDNGDDDYDGYGDDKNCLWSMFYYII